MLLKLYPSDETISVALPDPSLGLSKIRLIEKAILSINTDDDDDDGKFIAFCSDVLN